MKNYSVYDISGNNVGTVQATNADAALLIAIYQYGLGASVQPQYSTDAIGIDPLWILLALIVVGKMMSKKSH